MDIVAVWLEFRVAMVDWYSCGEECLVSIGEVYGISSSEM